MNKKNFKTDCIFFIGDKPCKYKQHCLECKSYISMGKKILIIKLDSKGDVLRTTPILSVLKEKYKKSYITWIVSENSKEILSNNNIVDRVLVYNFETLLKIQVEEFDLIISLDKSKEAAALATLAKSKKKVGYGLTKEGNICPINKSAEYEFNLGLSDDLKFNKNKKTYQEMIFEIAGFKFKREEYILNLTKTQEKISELFFKKNNIKKNKKVIGLNIGCGNRFPLKKWTVNGFITLAKKLFNKNFNVIILAGPKEKERYKTIFKKISSFVIDSGYNNSLEKFISIVNCCDLVVTGDTLALHIALALEKKVVALFGPTCSQEIDMYNRGIKISSNVECSPCYRNKCDKKPNCMDEVSIEEVLDNINNLINK